MLFFEIPVRGHSGFNGPPLLLFGGIWLYLFLNLEVFASKISGWWSLLPTVYDTITIQFWVSKSLNFLPQKFRLNWYLFVTSIS